MAHVYIVDLQEKELWTLTEDTGKVHSETGKPVKRPSSECGGYIAGLIGVVALAAAMVEPYIPSASARIANQLDVPLTALKLTADLISKASCPQSIIAAGTAAMEANSAVDESEACNRRTESLALPQVTGLDSQRCSSASLMTRRSLA